MDDFLLRAAAGGFAIVLVTGPLGCFVVWRRMAYFGATLAHAALLGVALGLALNINLSLGVLIVGIGICIVLYRLDRHPDLASDTVLGILAHSSLAIGLVLLSLMQGVRIDLTAYLFGDVLSIRTQDLYWLAFGATIVLLALRALWRSLLSMTVDEDLARVEGVAVEKLRLAFLLLVSVAVAMSMQVVGLLLTVSLLILPAASARRMVNTPEAMAGMSIVLGTLSVLLGLWGSNIADTPAGPSIVVAGTALFALSLVMPKRA
ncbi:MAG: zinc transport system permease protein [Gammaproteobacteria bacterium]|jgi:zinc transport system permease protein